MNKLCFLSLFIFVLPSFSTAAPSIGAVHATQTMAVVGFPAQIVIEASVTDPTLIAESVNLIQLGANGTSTVVATMHDDGLNGDRHGSDGIFTTVLSLNPAAPAQFQFQVTAAFKGQLLRPRSPILNIFFQLPNAPQQAISALALALTSGDVTTALTYVVPSDKNRRTINSLGPQGLTALASMLTGAVMVSSQHDLLVFQTSVNTPSGSAVIEFTMVPTPDGQWLINTW
jgi:hypothetical protein